MGFLMFTARIHSLMHQKLNIEYRLSKLAKKITDVQQYASLVGKGSISIGDLLNSPSSMTGRTMNYLAWAHNSALQYMQQNAPMMQQMYGQQMGMQNPQQAQQMQVYIQRMLYQQARDQASQIEARNLNEEEKRYASEKDKLEALLAEVNQDLKSAKEARDQGIKDFAPKYVA